MEDRRADRKDDSTGTPGSDLKKAYRPPAWEEEEVLEKTALACIKMPGLCVPGPANS